MAEPSDTAPEDSSHTTTEDPKGNPKGGQPNSTQRTDRMKALIKKKLKPVHQEIIAPPGQ